MCLCGLFFPRCRVLRVRSSPRVPSLHTSRNWAWSSVHLAPPKRCPFGNLGWRSTAFHGDLRPGRLYRVHARNLLHLSTSWEALCFRGDGTDDGRCDDLDREQAFLHPARFLNTRWWKRHRHDSVVFELWIREAAHEQRDAIVYMSVEQ